MNPSLELIDDKLIFDTKKSKGDETKDESEVTIEILRDIANSIDNMLTFIYDVSVNEKEDNRIDYEFFEKSSKNSRVLLVD